MAIADGYGLFWDSENGDRKYSASSFETWLKKFFTSGVFNGELAVTATGGMGISVSKGYTNVNGKVKFFDKATTFTLGVAGGVNPRIDIVVVERSDGDRNVSLKVVQGTYAQTPVAPSPVREGGIYQLVLAQIYVGVGVAEITQANITDTRADLDLCGFVTGTVEEIDFSEILQQFTAWFDEYRASMTAEVDAWFDAEQTDFITWVSEHEADFMAWYQHMKDQLDEDAAAHLQNEIDVINTTISGLPEKYENKHSWINYVIRADGWNDVMYSFESDYPSSEYDIDDILPQYGSSADQRKAWGRADCGGRYETNVIVAHGAVPTIDIPVVLDLKRRAV